MNRTVLFCILLLALFAGQRAGAYRQKTGGPEPRPTPTPAATPTPALGVAPDADYFQFGRVIKVEQPGIFDRTDPHQIASYSVFLCQSGETKKLLEKFDHVEEDKALGDSFQTFVGEFGPDLEAFKDRTLYLKFHGYFDGKQTSVWYYYLTDRNGEPLARRPWVSLHRSKRDGRCALTGIFVNKPGEDAADMPKNLKTS